MQQQKKIHNKIGREQAVRVNINILINGEQGFSRYKIILQLLEKFTKLKFL